MSQTKRGHHGSHQQVAAVERQLLAAQKRIADLQRELLAARKEAMALRLENERLSGALQAQERLSEYNTVCGK